MNGYAGGVAGTSRRGRVLAGMLVVWLAALAAGCDLLAGQEVDWPPQVPAGDIVRYERGQEGTVLAGDLAEVGVWAMAADEQGRLAIAGSRPDSVWLVDTDGSVRQLVARDTELPALPEGLDWPHLSEPEHVAFAPDGTVLFLEDLVRATLRAVDPETGEVRTVAGTGSSESYERRPFDGRPGDPLATRLDSTRGLAVADDGRVFIADVAHADTPDPDTQPASRVWVLDADWSRIEELAGPDGHLGELTGSSPEIALDGDVLWVLDSRAGVASRIDLAAGRINEIALHDLPDDVVLTHVVAAPDGGLFTTGGFTDHDALWHINPQGLVRLLRTRQQLGGPPGALATDGQLLYVSVRAEGLAVLRADEVVDEPSVR